MDYAKFAADSARMLANAMPVVPDDDFIMLDASSSEWGRRATRVMRSDSNIVDIEVAYDAE